jgi:hypothetical protein
MKGRGQDSGGNLGTGNFREKARVNILENPPPPSRGGKYQPMSVGKKNINGGRKKRENVKEKE